MGRETKILLAILGMLAGVFMGVVSLKLFVPRPPAGTGPDVHTAGEPLPVVDPPALDPPALHPQSFDPPGVSRDDPYAGRSSRFGAQAPSDAPPEELVVMPVAFEHVVTPDGADAAAVEQTVPQLIDSYDEAPVTPIAVPSPARRAGPVMGDAYVTREGDSWWSLAEQAYGDGRLYRALYAWNRSLDARVSLVPGTRLDIPQVSQLGAAWSTLLPTD